MSWFNEMTLEQKKEWILNEIMDRTAEFSDYSWWDGYCESEGEDDIDWDELQPLVDEVLTYIVTVVQEAGEDNSLSFINDQEV